MDQATASEDNKAGTYKKDPAALGLIAAYLYAELSQRLNTETVKVDAVTLWETDRACVTYTEE